MKIIIGTAQIGMRYGVAGGGDFNQKKVDNLLKLAICNNINSIDTAPGYGDAHLKIGKSAVKNLNIITKLPKLNLKTNPYKNIKNNVKNYLTTLNCKKLYCLLLHNPSDILSSYGKNIYLALKRLKEEGLIEKFGVSTYELGELNSIVDNFKIDIVQHPVNILDRRLEKSGTLKKLNIQGIEVHCRSVFLQGLLLLNLEKIDLKFHPFKKDLLKIHNFSMKSQKTIQEICLNYVLNIKNISKIIVGIDNEKQLKELIKIIENKEVINIPEFKISNKNILDPRSW